jgi:structural maintenance of chromosome 1
VVFRADFENEGLRHSEDRLTHLEAIIRTEQVNLEKLDEEKAAHARDIEALEANILSQEKELQTLQEGLDEKTKAVDVAKKTASKVSKVFDQAMKEIAACVSAMVDLSIAFADLYRNHNTVERRNRETLFGTFCYLPEMSTGRDRIATSRR